MSDDLPVEDHEPIPHEDNDAIVAGVVGANTVDPHRRSPFENRAVLWAAVVALGCFTLISALSTIAQFRNADRQAAVAEGIADQRQTEECWARLDAAADVARVAFEVGAARQHEAAWHAVLAIARGDTAGAQAKAAEVEALDAQLAALEAEVRAAVDAYRQGAEVCVVVDATTTTSTAPP